MNSYNRNTLGDYPEGVECTDVILLDLVNPSDQGSRRPMATPLNNFVYFIFRPLGNQINAPVEAVLNLTLFRLVLPPLWSGFLFYETTADKLIEDTGSSLLSFISLTP